MKSNKFLKVTGILMIIGGAIGIILGFITVLGVGAVALLIETSAGGLMFAAIMVLLSGVLQLIAGISGVKNSAKPEKARVCITLGIIVAVLTIVGNVTTVAFGGSFSVSSLVIGLVIPVLYLIGAFQSKKAAA